MKLSRLTLPAQGQRMKTSVACKGQTMMEYIILVSLLAVASIPVAKILGDVFRDRLLKAADKVAGSDSYSGEASKMVQDGREQVKKNMRDFAD